jgi:hypothetical protein
MEDFDGVRKYLFVRNEGWPCLCTRQSEACEGICMKFGKSKAWFCPVPMEYEPHFTRTSNSI